MRIFHVATAADWREAEQTGSYTTSTYGASLAELGFIHAARPRQVDGVLARFYSEVTEPLLLLEAETDLLDSPWRLDDVGGESFPHVYGPIQVVAVVAVTEIPGHRGRSRVET